MQWLREYSETYPDSDPFNLKPQNRIDWAAFIHDIKSWGGVLSDVRNNIVFSYQALISFLETNNPFDALAAPFITFFGTAANVVTEIAAAGGDVLGGLSSGFTDFFQGTQATIQSVWQGDFFGAVSSFFSGVGNAINSLINGIADAFRHLSPLVLDLDGDGVELLGNDEAANVRLFEADGNTFVQSGWVGPDDGVLGLDLNGNGRIDSLDGFVFTRMDPTALTDLEALGVLDDNFDGVLDSLDAAYARLMVWQDRNTDGFCDAGEAATLAAAGIVSLDLSLDGMVDRSIAGQDISHHTRFHRADGSSGLAADVAFLLSGRFGPTASPELVGDAAWDKVFIEDELITCPPPVEPDWLFG